MKNNSKTINIVSRPPIITIVGHIDHGKTTLLNCLRNVKKIEKEHGGITQYIKPYSINTKFGLMTFLDTPGHFAFNTIRKKSISYSDISILIIAADDGIQPQTIEAIEIVKHFGISILIAVNKIDKIANIEKNNKKLISELSKYGLTPEKWGGDTLMTFVSAKTGEGINNLLELVNLQAEMLDLKADLNIPANGIILDCKIDTGLGIVTTVIVLNGLLKKGDIIRVKNICGKVKMIMNDSYSELKHSELSLPLYITGLSNSIEIGEKFVVTDEFVLEKPIKHTIETDLDIKSLIANMKSAKKKINVVIKTDLQGTVDVLKDTLNKIYSDRFVVNIAKIEIGNINESDINFAFTINAFVIGFNVKYDSRIKSLSEKLSIKINLFNVIYDLIDFVTKLVQEKTSDETKDIVLGSAVVKKIFKYSTDNVVAGCVVISGKVKQDSKIKIFRKNTLIYQGVIESIKVFKKNVLEVKSGNECGISIKNYNNIQINDKIESIEK